MSTNKIAKPDTRHERALKLVDRLIKISPNEGLTRTARRLRAQLTRLPMREVLDKVPGQSISSKCRYLGITRQSYYAWLAEDHRPNKEQAKALEEITGYDAELIRRFGETSEPA
jgi:hypothetical protein